MFNVIFLVSGGEPDGATDILITQAYRWPLPAAIATAMPPPTPSLIFVVLFVQFRCCCAASRSRRVRLSNAHRLALGVGLSQCASSSDSSRLAASACPGDGMARSSRANITRDRRRVARTSMRACRWASMLPRRCGCILPSMLKNTRSTASSSSAKRAGLARPGWCRCAPARSGPAPSGAARGAALAAQVPRGLASCASIRCPACAPAHHSHRCADAG